MRELNEEEILTWMKQPDHRMFRYRIHAQTLAVLSLVGAFFLAVGLLVWVLSNLERELVIAGIMIVVGVNLMIWYRVITSIWFVGRNVLGVSPDELLIVEGYKGTLIPFRTLRENNIDWNERPPIGSTSSLPIHVDGKKYTLRLVSPYLSLEGFPSFLGLLLERLDEHSLSPTDTP